MVKIVCGVYRSPWNFKTKVKKHIYILHLDTIYIDMEEQDIHVKF